MNSGTALPGSSTGSLVFRLSTAGGALPVEGASVTLTGSGDDENKIYAVLRSDSSGNTPKIDLPAPQRSSSFNPDIEKPYAVYKASVVKEGYKIVENIMIPIFSGITALQPVEMLPAESSGGAR